MAQIKPFTTKEIETYVKIAGIIQEIHIRTQHEISKQEANNLQDLQHQVIHEITNGVVTQERYDSAIDLFKSMVNDYITTFKQQQTPTDHD